MQKRKQTTRPVDPVVVARERGQALREAAPEVPNRHRGRPQQARGPPLDADTQWLSLANTARYLDLSTMTITRYAEDEAYAHLGFPRPAVVVDRSYWNRDDLDAWMRSRVGAVSTRKVAR